MERGTSSVKFAESHPDSDQVDDSAEICLELKAAGPQHEEDVAAQGPGGMLLMTDVSRECARLWLVGADAVDWSNGGIGQGYPWWVFMAGRMEKFTAMLSEGIVSVSVRHSAGHRPFLSVTTAAQQHAVRISGGGRISIA